MTFRTIPSFLRTLAPLLCAACMLAGIWPSFDRADAAAEPASSSIGDASHFGDPFPLTSALHEREQASRKPAAPTFGDAPDSATSTRMRGSRPAAFGAAAYVLRASGRLGSLDGRLPHKTGPPLG